MKKGIFTAGKAVKNSTIKGYNFVREKVNHNENKPKDKEDKEIQDEAYINYMNSINPKNMNNQM